MDNTRIRGLSWALIDSLAVGLVTEVQKDPTALAQLTWSSAEHLTQLENQIMMYNLIQTSNQTPPEFILVKERTSTGILI